MANRVWFHLMGRGVVEPVDDFRDSNPPVEPRAARRADDQFVEHGRAAPAAGGLDHEVADLPGRRDPRRDATRDDEANFSRAAVRLLPAEVLLDAISQVLGSPERFRRAPRSLRAVQLPGVGGDVPFLKIFGKPDRLLTCECERSESTTLAQAFQMINGPTVRRKLEADDNRIARLLATKADDRAILDELYLAALGPRADAGRTRGGDRVSRRAGDRTRGMGRRRLGADQQQGIPAPALKTTRANAKGDHQEV